MRPTAIAAVAGLTACTTVPGTETGGSSVSSSSMGSTTSAGAGGAGECWRPIADMDAPTARGGMPSVWTGDALAIWGSRSAAGLEDNGALYYPEFDHWNPLPNAGAPGARSDHVGAWLGDRLLFHAGNGDLGGLSDGATFTAPFTWTDVGGLADNSGPGCGAWTGTDYIYFGDGFGTGARFNPVNGWTPLSAVGALEPRGYCQAVWTGKEVIVWGGIPDGPYEPGKRYDPASDTWTSMSTVNAPPALAYHSLVWTGSEMIVFGGAGSSSVPAEPVQAAGRYDPSTDSWTAISFTGAPSPRYGAFAVWTGSNMLVWGGAGSGQDANLDTGAAYDPTTDSWTIMSNVGAAPSARYRGAAVWTGAGMLVWGGAALDFGGETPKGDGAIYYPTCPD